MVVFISLIFIVTFDVIDERVEEGIDVDKGNGVDWVVGLADFDSLAETKKN
jgi:hypothetical protein